MNKEQVLRDLIELAENWVGEYCPDNEPANEALKYARLWLYEITHHN